jgi:hypothetical protein
MYNKGKETTMRLQHLAFKVIVTHLNGTKEVVKETKDYYLARKVGQSYAKRVGKTISHVTYPV